MGLTSFWYNKFSEPIHKGPRTGYQRTSRLSTTKIALKKECHSCNSHLFSMLLVSPIERDATQAGRESKGQHPTSKLDSANRKREYTTEYKSPVHCFSGTNQKQRVWPLHALYLESALT